MVIVTWGRSPPCLGAACWTATRRGQLDQGVGAAHRPRDLFLQGVAFFQGGAVQLVRQRIDLRFQQRGIPGGKFALDDRRSMPVLGEGQVPVAQRGARSRSIRAASA
ncbi:MAG: hypothetical protein R2719_14445 [Micropruina sp.]